MSQGRSAAKPENLQTFVTRTNGAQPDIERWVVKLRANYEAFQASASVGRVASGPVEQALPALLQRQREDTVFVDLVRQAFLTADTDSLGGGLVSVSDGNLQAAYERAAANRGLNAAYFDADTAPLVVPPAVTGAVPQDSGFVNDPVCTATGHFLEDEIDFVVPGRLAVLAMPRRYSSRLLRPGPFGRGWWSWADVRLVPDASGDLAYQGPDGVALTVPADGRGGWSRPTGLDATVTAGADGDLVLTWDLTAAYGGQRWTFTAAGALAEVWGPQLGTTRLTQDERGRLAELAHEGGRTLTLTWSGERVTAAALSDGRLVAYHYDDDGDLAAVERAIDPRRYETDGLGRIVAVLDADDVRLCHNSYDEQDRVVRQVSPFGRETVLTYLDGRTTRVSDTDGGPAALYEHDRRGRLTGMVGADGHRLDRRFDERGRIVEQRDVDGATFRCETTVVDDIEIVTRTTGDGRREVWHYDERRRVVVNERAGGRRLDVAYDGESPLPTRLSGPLGWSMTYEWRDGLPVTVTDADGVTVQFEHDTDGCLTASTDGAGNTTRYRWHRTGRPTEILHPDGAVGRMEWDDAGQLVALIDTAGEAIRFELSPAGRLRAIVDAEGGRTTFVHGSHGAVEQVIDPLGHATEFRHDQFEHLAGLTNADGTKWELAYSALGQLSLITGPDGSTWSATADASGRLASLTDAAGHVVETRYDAAGRLAGITDALGGETSHRYDDVGNVVESVDPAGGTLQMAWDALDRMVEVADADGVTWHLAYTPAGRLAASTDGEGNTVRHEYDASGRVVAVIRPGGGRVTSAYDSRGRLVTQQSPAGRTTAYAYDRAGRLAAVTQGRAEWGWRYDRAGRPVAVIDPLGATTRYRYDAAGRLVASVDPRGATTTFRRDAMGRIIAAVDPFGREVAVEHDALGRVVAVTDQLGRTTRYTYDGAGRLATTLQPGGTRVDSRRDARGALLGLVVDGIEEVTFERDALGRTTAVHEPGRGRTSGFEWSPAGRLRAATNGARALRYTFDGAGRLVGREAIDGTRTVSAERYAHDADGRLRSVTAAGFGSVELGRDADGLLTGLRTAGTERRWSYDERRRVIAHGHRAGSGPWRTTTVHRDAAGNTVAVEVDGVTTHYTYDAGGQLTGVDDNQGTRRYDYDEAGRLVAEHGPSGDRTFTYDAAHQLTAVTAPAGTTTLTYDAQGRRVAETGPARARRYEWDGLDRLTAVADDRAVTPIDVDAVGRLAAVGDTQLWWDTLGPVERPVAIGDRTLLSVAGHPTATAGPGAELEWLAPDWRGSVATRDEWGRTSAPAPGDDGGPVLGFGGEVELAGLVWLRHRIYDPGTAQFLSRDPLPGVSGSTVASFPYHYAANNPIDHIDPLGLRPLSLDDYNAARDRATGVQWGNIAKAGLMVAGVAATILIPGAGILVGVAIGAGLGAVMGAGPAVIDGITTGNWDVGAIVKGAAVGAIAGGIGGAIPGAGAFLSAGAGAALRIGANAAIGAASGAVEGAVGELYDLTSLPGSDGRFDASQVGLNALIGGAASGGMSVRGPASSTRGIDLDEPGAAPFITYGDITPGAQRLVDGFQTSSRLPMGSSVPVTDIREASMFMGVEVGVARTPDGSLVAVRGTQTRTHFAPDDTPLVHTHPVGHTEPDHFGYDIPAAGDDIEAVVDWSGDVTHFNNTGIVTNPPTSPINDQGFIT